MVKEISKRHFELVQPECRIKTAVSVTWVKTMIPLKNQRNTRKAFRGKKHLVLAIVLFLSASIWFKTLTPAASQGWLEIDLSILGTVHCSTCHIVITDDHGVDSANDMDAMGKAETCWLKTKQTSRKQRGK